jgi:hypothetical protein
MPQYSSDHLINLGSQLSSLGQQRRHSEPILTSLTSLGQHRYPQPSLTSLTSLGHLQQSQHIDPESSLHTSRPLQQQFEHSPSENDHQSHSSAPRESRAQSITIINNTQPRHSVNFDEYEHRYEVKPSYSSKMERKNSKLDQNAELSEAARWMSKEVGYFVPKHQVRKVNTDAAATLVAKKSLQKSHEKPNHKQILSDNEPGYIENKAPGQQTITKDGCTFIPVIYKKGKFTTCSKCRIQITTGAHGYHSNEKIRIFGKKCENQDYHGFCFREAFPTEVGSSMADYKEIGRNPVEGKIHGSAEKSKFLFVKYNVGNKFTCYGCREPIKVGDEGYLCTESNLLFFKRGCNYNFHKNCFINYVHTSANLNDNRKADPFSIKTDDMRRPILNRSTKTADRSVSSAKSTLALRTPPLHPVKRNPTPAVAPHPSSLNLLALPELSVTVPPALPANRAKKSQSFINVESKTDSIDSDLKRRLESLKQRKAQFAKSKDKQLKKNDDKNRSPTLDLPRMQSVNNPVVSHLQPTIKNMTDLLKTTHKDDIINQIEVAKFKKLDTKIKKQQNEIEANQSKIDSLSSPKKFNRKKSRKRYTKKSKRSKSNRRSKRNKSKSKRNSKSKRSSKKNSKGKSR